MSEISLSTATTESLLASESGDALIFLITISHPDLAVPARICTAALQRVEETDEDVVYGLVSQGETFVHVPSVGITLPTDDDESPPAIGLSIDRYDDVVDVVRSIGVDAPTVDVQMVLSATPDLLEAAWPEFDLQNVSIEQDVITGTLGQDMLETEPGCPYSFNPSSHPGLF